MMNQIIQFDQTFFLFLNQLNHTSIDPIMHFLSKSYIPGIMILLFMLIYGFKKYQKGVILLLFLSFVTIGIADGVSSRLLKPTVKRLRPCHEPLLKEQVYTGGKHCWGGKYGFVSSHAANTFGVAMFLFLIFKAFTTKTFVLFIWAGLVSYSRIYLAKHYPLDILFGGLLGLVSGYICFKLFNYVSQKLKWSYQDQ